MPDLTCVVDGEAEDIVSGTNMETMAEDTSPALGMNTSATSISVQWVNSSDIACQPSNGYLEFDTSGVTSTPESATLKLNVSTVTNSGPSGVYVMKAFFASAGSLSTADQASYTRSGVGETPDIGDMVKYSSEITSFSTGELEITLNSTALSDMVSRDEFQIAIVSDSLADQTSAPNDGVTRAFIFSSQNHGTTGNRPVLNYVEPTVPPLNVQIRGLFKINKGKFIIK